MNLDPTLNLIDWTTGETYLAVTCKNCGWQFPFAQTTDKLPQCPLQIVCIECEESSDYCPKEFTQLLAI